MAIVFDCPCGRKMKVRETLAGRTGRCPGCGTIQRIPGADTIDLGHGADTIDELPEFVPSSHRPAEIDSHSMEKFEYKVVQIDPDLPLDDGASYTEQAAIYLSRLLNKQAAHHWQFHRIDQVHIRVGPGPLRALLRLGPAWEIRQLVTFRRLISE